MNGYDRQTIRVLIVDDDEDDYILARSMLEEIRSAVYTTEWIHGFDQALAALSATSVRHDVALVDFRLGDRSGLELLMAVGSSCHIPVIMMTGYEDHTVDVAATQAGAADYLVKVHTNSPLLERAIRYAIERKRVESAWRHALAENYRLATAISNLSTGVLVTDPAQPDNPVVFVNQAFTDITGYSVMETIGRNCRFLQGPDTDPETRRQVHEAIEERRPFRGAILNYRKDGTQFWNDLTINPVMEQGRLVSYVGLVNDITEIKLTEQSLLRSQEQLAEAQRLAHLGSWTWNPAAHNASWSQELFRIFGREPNDHPVSWAELERWVYPPDREKLKQASQEILGSAARKDTTLRIIRDDGQQRIIQLQGAPVTNPSGQVVMVHGTIQDITELKQAEEALRRANEDLEERVRLRTEQLAQTNQVLKLEIGERKRAEQLLREREERLRSGMRELWELARLEIVEQGELDAALQEITQATARLLEVERAGVWLLNDDRSSLICCDLYEKAEHHHTSKQTLARADYPIYFQALEEERAIVVHDTVSDKRTAEFTDSYSRPLGIPSMLNVPIVAGGEVMGVLCHEHVGVLRTWSLQEEALAVSVADLISLTIASIKRRRVEESLHQAKIEAEHQRENAERANAAKSEFLSRMSHELRTPLNSILGFGQLLQRSSLDERQHERLNLIVAAGSHLLDLINEILDLARVESGRIALSLEPVNICEVSSEIVSLTRPLAEHDGVTMEDQISETAQAAGIECFVLADRQRLKQVLLNLLSNAIKYNLSGGAVRLWCEAVPPSSDAPTMLRIFVSDTGHGIESADLSRLFVPFERLHDQKNDVEGTGLGLALSRRLVEAMGGEIGVQSTPGVETVFYFTLPLAHAPDLSKPLPLPPSVISQMDNLRVLYIEDNLANLKLIENIFADIRQVELTSAMQGGLGLDLARQHLPDLILLDLHLPDIGGEEVLLRLKNDARTQSIPVMVLSADATPGQVERLSRAGAAQYLTKPLDVAAFLTAVQSVVGGGNGNEVEAEEHREERV